jgi:hypothetical protein
VRARRIVVAVVLVLCVACTVDRPAPTGPPSSPPTTPSAPPSVDPGDVAFEPGEFQYEWRRVRIRFSMDGNGGTLEIDNASGSRLGEPGLYAILGDGTRRDGTIGSPAGIPDGEQASFEVTFPSDVDETTVGLIVLLIGGNNWGALAPVPAAT